MKTDLSPIEEKDLELLKNWRNDPDIMQRTRQWRELTMTDQKRWYESLYEGKWPENMMWMISVWVDNMFPTYGAWRAIGVCGLCHIDWIARSAEVSIYIGEESWRNKGVATDVVECLKRITFDRLNLNLLWAENYRINTVNAKLLTKCGFIKTGFRENAVYKNGRYYGSDFYDFRRSEYEPKG